MSEPTDPSISDDLWKKPVRARLLVSDADAGRVIGRGGSAVTAVESTSGAHVKLSRRGQFLPGTDCRVLLVSGLFHQVMDATELILEKLVYQVPCSALLSSGFVSVQSDGLGVSNELLILSSALASG